MEDKRGFVGALMTALAEHGDGRYDHLDSSPVAYLDESDGLPKGLELLEYRGARSNVSGDSLPRIAALAMGLVLEH